MNFLKSLAIKHPALSRSIEISLISSLISGAIALLQAINSFVIGGPSIDWRFILSLFLISVITGITAGLTKFLRDKEKLLTDEPTI